MNAKSLILIILIGLFSFLSSCNLDPCKDVTCNNHGDPQEDSRECVCVCDTGWEGDNCTIQNKCKGVTCVNGTCNEETGICICKAGYEGDSCNIFSREKFLEPGLNPSRWEATDTCGVNDVQQYLPGIEKGAAHNTLFVVGFFGYQDSIRVSADKSEISQLANAVLGGVTISNLQGQISAGYDTIYVTYNRIQAGVTNSCSGVWTRL